MGSPSSPCVVCGRIHIHVEVLLSCDYVPRERDAGSLGGSRTFQLQVGCLFLDYPISLSCKYQERLAPQR